MMRYSSKLPRYGYITKKCLKLFAHMSGMPQLKTDNLPFIDLAFMIKVTYAQILFKI